MKTKAYKILTKTRVVKDEASVKFHVKSDDYFGTIATILSLLKQDIEKSGRPDRARLLQTLHDLTADFIFLQKNYKIFLRSRTKSTHQTKPNIKKRKIIPKGKLISQ